MFRIRAPLDLSVFRKGRRHGANIPVIRFIFDDPPSIGAIVRVYSIVLPEECKGQRESAGI
jgi:hypothetical protein